MRPWILDIGDLFFFSFDFVSYSSCFGISFILCDSFDAIFTVGVLYDLFPQIVEPSPEALASRDALILPLLPSSSTTESQPLTLPPYGDSSPSESREMSPPHSPPPEPPVESESVELSMPTPFYFTPGAAGMVPEVGQEVSIAMETLQELDTHEMDIEREEVWW